MKTFCLAIAATLISGAAATGPARFDYDGTPSGNNKCALINVIMDESGSMTGDQNFMKTRVLPKLGQTLHSATYGYDDVFLCSAGFGYGTAHYANNANYYHMGCTKITAAGDIINMNVVDWLSYGSTEDGWLAMKQGMADVYAQIEGVNLLNNCASIDKNMILVTDEDRDCTTYVNKSWLKWKIYDNGYILNVVVDICIGHVGISSASSCRGSYAPDANKFGMQISSGGGDATVFEYSSTAASHYVEQAVTNTWYDSYVWHDAGTADHYSDLVIDEAGAVWNINSMRCTLPGVAEAFADVFVIIKALELSGPDDRGESSSNGDPHFTTWKKEHYEYHGQCDLVLAKDPAFAGGLGLDIQIRTKLVRFWSYIGSAAIRIGADILEIQGHGSEQDAKYWINFERKGSLSTVGGFPVRIADIDDGSKGIQRVTYEIDLGSKYPGQMIVIRTFKEFVNVRVVGATAEAFGSAVGMWGDFRTGHTLARDGVTVLSDFSEFGSEWQVLPSDEMLFYTTEEPQFPQKCIEPEDPRGQRRRRLDESSISETEAEKACSALKDPMDRKDCVYDILATQDLDMVGAF
ncbi:unnamed protein product [Cylindrotheca closterium]|uniref:VWFD domain-containing protein n=1 Tax=Cylindrotheca closterium TaxID=2856 RepID=A0AAD2FPW2_9STRA|nr:unnamed protein product [Cylindrotheca closterium]